MGALGGSSASSTSSSAFGALLGGSLAGPSPSTTTDFSGQEERTAQLEREVSTLTNENLKLKDQMQDLL